MLYNSQKVHLYNSLTSQKEVLQPLTTGHIGMYVCGPTVYNNVHLGNVRTFVSFDVIFRYLKHLGYKVRYVRNITDAGHLENDADTGEDRIAKKARLEQLEPMEIVQRYTVDFHNVLTQLNCLPPSIEPTATGHIIEQIEIIKKIIEEGFAYEINGSVYFDVIKFNKTYTYGKLSHRKIEELIHNTRELEGQFDKKNPQDFALWKRAEPQHIMRWPSPWSDGFPGWHLECTAMSTKYLGKRFDIHGGGMDLKFPHHECEIAQSEAFCKEAPVNYWLHANMLTLNGKKMSKSTGNSILPSELFSGNNSILSKAFAPPVARFFMLQAHYRSVLDFSNEAIIASEKGFHRLMNSLRYLDEIIPSEEKSDPRIPAIVKSCYDAMNDDFNSPMLIANLFEFVKIIQQVREENHKISKEDLKLIRSSLHSFVFDILGIQSFEQENKSNVTKLQHTVELLINLRNQARENKDFKTSDKIRDDLSSVGILLRDTKEGYTQYEIE